MLHIYDTEQEIPEAVREHYVRRSDGKWEPQIEGINSVGGLLAKRDELLNKTREMPRLQARLAELESGEVLVAGKIAVDKKTFDDLTSENEAYKALGPLDEIKPKVEGFDELKQQQEAKSKEETYRAVAEAAGFNVDRFVSLASIEKIEPIELAIKENGKDVKKWFVPTTDPTTGKEIKQPIEDYVKESPTFQPFADTLGDIETKPTGNGNGGVKMFKQGGTKPATPTIETEKEAAAKRAQYSI